MNKKLLCLGLASCFAVVSLSSCGGHASKISLPEINVLSYDAIKDKKITIEFWHGFGENKEKPLNEVLGEFKKLYPNIEVKAESKGGYDGLKEAVSLSVPTGKTPDVVLGYPDHIAEYLSAGIVCPLDDYMNSEDPEIGIGAGAHNAKDDFFEDYMKENRQYYNDLTFGLPFNKSTELGIYNKTVFDEFDIEVPTTWQGIEKAAADLKAKIPFGEVYTCKKESNKDKNGNFLKLNFTEVKKEDCRPFTYDSKANCFITMTKDFGGTYTEVGDSIEEGYVTFDNDGTKAAMGLLKDLSNKTLFGIPDHWEEKYCSTMFKQLKSFYTVGSSAGADYNLPDADGFKVGVAPIPYFDDGTTVRKNVIQQGTNIAMLSNNTDEERMASWLLIRFLTAYHREKTDTVDAYDANAAFALGSLYLPVRESALESPDYKEFIEADTSLTTAKETIQIEAAANAKKYNDKANGWTKFTDPAFVGSSKVRKVVDQVVPTICMTNKSVDDAIKGAYDELSTYVKR